MGRAGRLSRRATCMAATLSLAVLSGAPARAEAVSLSPPEMRAATAHALSVGDDDTALTLAAALLARDPKDGFALISRSRAARNMGLYDTALAAARAAWAIAETDGDRYAAALVMAQALSSQGARTRAQIWLRRAAEAAPDEVAKARAMRDFRYVRARNPWRTNLRFGVTPSSNVNNGTQSETMDIGGLTFALSGDARALSGLEYSYGADTTYTWQLDEGLSVWAGGGIDGRAYTLSENSRKTAPTLTSEDLAYQEARLSFGLRHAASPEAGPLTVNLTVARAFYGGDALSDLARASALKVLPLTANSHLEAGLSVEGQWRHDDPTNDSTSFGGSLGWAAERGNGDILRLQLGLGDTVSDAATLAHDSWSAGISYRFAKPMAGAYLGLSASYEESAYDLPLFAATPRADQTTTLEATAFLPKLEKYGFAPEIGLRAVRNSSNVTLYDYTDYGVRLGLRSAF